MPNDLLQGVSQNMIYQGDLNSQSKMNKIGEKDSKQ